MSFYTATTEALVDRLSSLIVEFEELSKDHSEKKAEFESKKDQQDILLSTLKEKFEGSNTVKTDRAYRDQMFQNFMTSLGRSRLEYYLAQSKLRAVETKIEAMRTIISLRKEEINKFRG